MATLNEIGSRYEAVYPDVDAALVAGFWAGAAAGELRLPHCTECKQFHWYPLYRCPHCQASNWSWKAVEPRARLFSWTILRRALDKDFEARLGDVVALVELPSAPGVRLVGNVFGAEHLEVDMDLTVAFAPLSDGRAVPVFLPPVAGVSA